jgi:hypothetical protein
MSNIIGVTESMTFRWVGHAAHMEGKKRLWGLGYKTLSEKSIWKN